MDWSLQVAYMLCYDYSLKGQCDSRKPFKFCCDFTAHEIITSSIFLFSLSVFSQLRAWWQYRPRKHSLGWQSINTRIYLKETLADWRRLRSELGLSNSDVPVFSLQRNKTLTDILANEGCRPASRLVSH